MSLVFLLLACVAGAGLGAVQIRLTMRLMKKPNIWLAVAKLPLWGLPMLAAARLSIFALLGLAAGASAAHLACAIAGFRRLSKGEDE
jgi:hypothetical protein